MTTSSRRPVSDRMPTHPCPIKGPNPPDTSCTQQVSFERLMCLYHWRMVPRRLGSDLYMAYGPRGEGQGSEEHISAMAACIKAVEDKLAA